MKEHLLSATNLYQAVALACEFAEEHSKEYAAILEVADNAALKTKIVLEYFHTDPPLYVVNVDILELVRLICDCTKGKYLINQKQGDIQEVPVVDIPTRPDKKKSTWRAIQRWMKK